MKKLPPDEGQLEHWLKTAFYLIDLKKHLRADGYYEKKKLPLQGYYSTLASGHANLGRTRFLNGDPVPQARAEFIQAADYMIKVFRMAYDPDEPEFAGEKTNWARVSETCAIDGMNWALMSGDLGKAKEMARWWQNRPTKTMPEVANRYTHALKHAILGNRDQAEEPLEASMLYYASHPPAGHNFKTNYYTLSTTLLGIVTKDQKKFTEGLALQLKFYEGEALSPENYNVPEGFIADDAAALANLGIFYGLKVTVTHMLLPPRLLAQPA